MSVYRARSMCPSCSSESEIWIQKSKVEPIGTIYCSTCSGLYDPSDFIMCFLELRQNVTISSSTAVTLLTL
jgi:hypothetical protein